MITSTIINAEDRGSFECQPWQEKNYLGNCIDKELTVEEECEKNGGVYFSSDKTCLPSSNINVDDLSSDGSIAPITGGNPEDALDGGVTPIMITDLETGKQRLETPEETSERLNLENTTPPVNTIEPPKPTINPQRKTLTDYCEARGKDGKSGGFINYDGACEKNESAFGELTSTTNRVLKWIVNMSLLIAAAMAFYAGWLYIASATDPGARSKANSIFKGVAIGLFIIFSAWLMVKFILFFFAKGEATTDNINDYDSDNFTGLQE